jgi:hypothetical protein
MRISPSRRQYRSTPTNLLPLQTPEKRPGHLASSGSFGLRFNRTLSAYNRNATLSFFVGLGIRYAAKADIYGVQIDDR